MTTDLEYIQWVKTILPVGSTIQQAINCLDKSGMQIVLAVREGEKLAGTLTDGDIRRGFLKGLGLDSLIDDVMNPNPLVVPLGMGRELVLQVMRINKVHQLPIISEDGAVVGLHIWDSIISPEAIENTMIIMAGGKGTRLHPFTQNCPKPMLDLGGKPILQHVIERAIGDGFVKFVISLHYMGNVIEEYFGDGSKFGVHVEYIKEAQPLGTAGSLSLISMVTDLPFVVTNGDVLTSVKYKDIIKFHEQHNSSATMAVREHEIKNEFGVVNTRGLEIVKFEEKPIHRFKINAGIYVLNPDALEYLDYGERCDMPELFNRIKQGAGRTIVYPLHEDWLDIGRPAELIHARSSMQN